MKKFLFIDFDGVLNNSSMWFSPFENSNQADYLSSNLVSKLNPIVEATNCFIVISSSWRNEFSLDDIKRFLTEKGFKHSDKVVGVTPKNKHGKRGFEISDWLISYGKFDNYAILDDVDFNIEEVHPNRFVRTNSDFGLTDNDSEKIIKILNS